MVEGGVEDERRRVRGGGNELFKEWLIIHFFSPLRGRRSTDTGGKSS